MANLLDLIAKEMRVAMTLTGARHRRHRPRSAGQPAMSGHDALLAQLRDAVGSRHVTGDKATRRFRRGYRFGDGPVLAVVRPGTLLELWRVLGGCARRRGDHPGQPTPA